MIFSVIILLLMLAVAYFQYVQGFLSATLSAFLCVVAAVLAMSYHEPLVESLLKGKYSDQANAMALCVLFAAIYIILRLLFDMVIPGNIRVPVLAEKIGAGAMGLVVGIYATGIVAIAAQLLPFGPSVGGYSRYTMIDERDVIIADRRNAQENAWVLDETKGDRFEEADRESLLVPVDDILVGTVNLLSGGGSLAGSKSFESVHPAYLDELFGQRISAPIGAKKTAPAIGGKEMVQVNDVWMVSGPGTAVPYQDIEPFTRPSKMAETTYTPEGILVAVRTVVDKDASDNATGFFRIAPAGARLVVNGKNHYPIGRLDGPTLTYQRIDDPIVYNLKEANEALIDFVYEINSEDLQGGVESGLKFGAGDFLEVKRLARVSLGGKSIGAPATAPATPLMRKKVPNNWNP